MVSEHAESLIPAQRRAPPERVDAMLKQGLSPTSIARELRLKESYVHERAKLVRLDRTGQSVDVTVSQFARHDEHCAAVMEFGGYPVIDHASRRIVGPTGGAWPGILRQA